MDYIFITLSNANSSIPEICEGMVPHGIEIGLQSVTKTTTPKPQSSKNCLKFA